MRRNAMEPGKWQGCSKSYNTSSISISSSIMFDSFVVNSLNGNKMLCTTAFVTFRWWRHIFFMFNCKIMSNIVDNLLKLFIHKGIDDACFLITFFLHLFILRLLFKPSKYFLSDNMKNKLITENCFKWKYYCSLSLIRQLLW